MCKLLGTPGEHKRAVLYPGGHVFPFGRIIRDTLDWFDTYLGAVQQVRSPALPVASA